MIRAEMVSALAPTEHDEMLGECDWVYQCVERCVRESGHSLGAAKMAGITHKQLMNHRWLKRDAGLLERLHAWDIPIGKFFTACRIRNRALNELAGLESEASS